MLQVEIQIRGHLTEDWSDWVGGLRVACDEHGETVLIGPLLDQAALRGVLDRLADLGLDLISVTTDKDVQSRTHAERSSK